MKIMVKDKKIILEEGKFPAVCSGCRLCEIVCSFRHEAIFAPWLSRIRVVTVEHLIDYPVTCKLCKNPPCQKACPVNAISKSEDTEGIKLEWGNFKTVYSLIEQMAHKKGFGEILCDGQKVAASRIGKGSEEFEQTICGD